MHTLFGEVAAPLPALGISIISLCFWLVALGLAVLVLYLSHILTWLLQNTLGRLPWIGSAIADVARSLESEITRTLSGAIAGIDANIARFWHALAVEWDWTVRVSEDAARIGLAIASVAVGMPNAQARGWIHTAIHAALGELRSLIHAAEHRLSSVERQITHAGAGAIGAEIHAVVKPLQGELHTLERWTYPKVRALDYTVTGVLEPDIAALRDRVKTLEDGAISVYRDAAGALHLSSVERFAAAMTLTLPALGLEWLRCRGMRNFFRSTGCGLGNLMETLLGDAFVAFAVTDICEFSHLAEEVALELKPALFDLVDAAEALVGCHGATLPGPLGVPLLPALTVGAGLSLAGV